MELLIAVLLYLGLLNQTSYLTAEIQHVVTTNQASVGAVMTNTQTMQLVYSDYLQLAVTIDIIDKNSGS